MIFANISNLEEYSFLDKKIKECFDYYKENDLKDFALSLIHI